MAWALLEKRDLSSVDGRPGATDQDVTCHSAVSINGCATPCVNAQAALRYVHAGDSETQAASAGVGEMVTNLLK